MVTTVRPRVRAGAAAVAAALTAGLAVGIVTTAPSASGMAMKSSRPDREYWSDRYSKRVEFLINRERRRHGLRGVGQTGCAARWASSWSNRLAAADEFEHSNLGGLLDRCHATYASENIAMIYDGARPRDVVALWMKSPGHRHNILSGMPSSTGVSVRWDVNREAWILVQNFVRR